MQLIYLSPVPWSSFAQRPHKFVQWFHEKTGASVLWIDPYPSRFPVWQDFNRKLDVSNFVQEAAPKHIQVVQSQCIPVEPLPGSGYLNAMFWGKVFEAVDTRLKAEPAILCIGKPSELALRLLATRHFKCTIYDAMDDFPAFHTGLSSTSMFRRERLIVDRVTHVLVSSTELQKRWLNRPNVLLARNACDTKTLPLANVKASVSENIVIGYVGTIGKWFDWDLVFSIAHARPKIKITLIGPMYCPSPYSIPSNIEVRPQCSHSQAMLAMQNFSVGLIPFVKNKLTESVDPIKYYEYRALGLPVISSFFGEMRFHRSSDGVFVIDTPAEINKAIDAALTYKMTTAEIEKFRYSNSWNQRFSDANIPL
jgi:hypothetical protein